MASDPDFHDIIIKTGDTREGLQSLLDGLPGVIAMVGDNSAGESRYDVRVLHGLDFLRFAFDQQGWGEIEDESDDD